MQCKLCDKPLKAEDAICEYCGYDPKTDRVSESFKPKSEAAIRKEEKEKARKEGAVGSGVKKFAMIGLAVVIFSVLYKYNFNINGVARDAGLFLDRIKSGNLTRGKDAGKKETENEKIELISVRSFDGSKQPRNNKEQKIEGIFFDESGKSFVIVNGKLLPEGGSLGDFTVKKIYKGSVELILGDELINLRINQVIPASGK